MDLQEELSYEELRILVKLAKVINEEVLVNTPVTQRNLQNVSFNETRLITELVDLAVERWRDE